MPYFFRLNFLNKKERNAFIYLKSDSLGGLFVCGGFIKNINISFYIIDQLSIIPFISSKKLFFSTSSLAITLTLPISIPFS